MRSWMPLRNGPGKSMAIVDDSIRIEVVAAMPERQELVELSLDKGVTAGEAIDQSAFADLFPMIDIAKCEIAVWGRVVDRATVLKSGDRVEILRTLAIDPREARRAVASQGGYMGSMAKPPNN